VRRAVATGWPRSRRVLLAPATGPRTTPPPRTAGRARICRLAEPAGRTRWRRPWSPPARRRSRSGEVCDVSRAVCPTMTPAIRATRSASTHRSRHRVSTESTVGLISTSPFISSVRRLRLRWRQRQTAQRQKFPRREPGLRSMWSASPPTNGLDGAEHELQAVLGLCVNRRTARRLNHTTRQSARAVEVSVGEPDTPGVADGAEAECPSRSWCPPAPGATWQTSVTSFCSSMPATRRRTTRRGLRSRRAATRAGRSGLSCSRRANMPDPVARRSRDLRVCRCRPMAMRLAMRGGWQCGEETSAGRRPAMAGHTSLTFLRRSDGHRQQVSPRHR
jgi:hypothetical protein